MTTTAFVFPGLNAIFRDRDRHRYDHLSCVQENFQYLPRFGFDKELHLTADQMLSESRYAGIAAISLAIQCGAYQELLRVGIEPKILAGCSLGDVARSICCGALTLEDALGTLAALRAPLATLQPSGKTVAIRMPGPHQLTPDVVHSLEAAGFEPSILSARHMTIACIEENEESLKQLCASSSWHFKDTEVPFALHSRHLLATVKAFAPLIKLTPRPMSKPVFSSIQLKRLDTWEDLIGDAYKVFSTPIQWPRTLSLLRSTQGITRFINIGPCNSLTLLARETDRSVRIEPAGKFFKAC